MSKMAEQNNEHKGFDGFIPSIMGRKIQPNYNPDATFTLADLADLIDNMRAINPDGIKRLEFSPLDLLQMDDITFATVWKYPGSVCIGGAVLLRKVDERAKSLGLSTNP
jgi:hypothetical protein